MTLALKPAMIFLPAVVLLGAGIAFRVLNGKPLMLPASIPERTQGRRAVVRAAVIILPILASISALDRLGDRGYHTAAFMSVLLTLIAMPLLLIFYLIARKNDRAASHLVADAWVSWTYDAGEWRCFTGAQSNPQMRRLGRQAPQFFAGSPGILVGDKFVPWRASGIVLKEAVRQSGAPDFVSFRFEVSYGKGPMTVELAAPIPPNSERDLRYLHDKLSTSYPSARVKLV